MPLSTYSENKLIDHIAGKTSFTIPAGCYITLFTTLPSKAGTGGTEMAVTRQAATWNAAASGANSTNATITFTGVPAGTIVGWGAFDASTAGNLLFFNEIEQTATAESITLVGGIASLANANVSSVVVKDSTDTTTYTEGTDYVVQYDSGTICRLSGSAFTATANLHVTYQYPLTRTVLAGDNFQFSSGNIGLAFKGYK